MTGNQHLDFNVSIWPPECCQHWFFSHQGHHTEESSSVEVEAEVVHYRSGPEKPWSRTSRRFPTRLDTVLGDHLTWLYFWTNKSNKKLGRFLQQKPSSFSLKKILRSIPRPHRLDCIFQLNNCICSLWHGGTCSYISHMSCFRSDRFDGFPVVINQPHWSWH